MVLLWGQIQEVLEGSLRLPHPSPLRGTGTEIYPIGLTLNFRSTFRNIFVLSRSTSVVVL